MEAPHRSSRGGAVPDPIDLANIDTTVCAQCKEVLPSETWRREESSMRPCCGARLCRKCALDFEDSAAHARSCGRKLEVRLSGSATNAASNAAESSPAEETLPDLIRNFSEADEAIKLCPSCNSFPPKTQAQMVFQLKRCADAGQAAAQFDLADCIYGGKHGLEQDSCEALKLYHQAATQGHTLAQAKLAWILSTFVEEFELAKHWAEKCCDTDAMAQHALGLVYSIGSADIPKDAEKAIELFRMSAEQGFPPGIRRYGDSLASAGRKEEALEWYIKGGSDETRLTAYQPAIAACQYYAAVLCRELLDKNGAALFWAKRAKRNGHRDAEQLYEDLNELMWRACALCGGEPKDRCNDCRRVAYCSRACQVAHWQRHKGECRRSLPEITPKATEYSIFECSFCHKESPGSHCGHCQKAWYCDNDCQQQHWPFHRTECKDAQKAARKAAAAADTEQGEGETMNL